MTTLSSAQRGAVPGAVIGNWAFRLKTVRHELGKFRPRNRPFYRVFKLPHSLEVDLLRFDQETPADRHGRCPFRKMQAMAGLIVQHNLQFSVEIGVYRGSSLLPQAMAMRHTGGRAFGIDPWSMAKWRQNQARSRADAVPGAEYDAGVAKISWDSLYREVLDKVSRYALDAHCRIIRGLSFEVVDEIDTEIDLLHIDGNHDSDAVARDLRHYLPKVRDGGFVVMDDITWQGVEPHYRDLKQTMPVIWETPDWAILRKT